MKNKNIDGMTASTQSAVRMLCRRKQDAHLLAINLFADTLVGQTCR